MFFTIKQFIRLKLFEGWYKIRTYRSNLAIRKAFRESGRVSYGGVAFIAFLFFATATISLGSIYRGNDILGITSILREGKSGGVVEELLSFKPNISEKALALIRPAYKIVIDKKQRVLFILDKDYVVREKFPIIIGEKGGDKEREGDLKTPRGVYKIVEIKEDKDLPPMYGPYAFVLNYPNEMDLKAGKTGSNIWIHGIGGVANRMFTKGCIAVDDNVIMRLTEYIGIDTAIYIYPYGFEVPTDGHTVSGSVISDSFLYSLDSKVSG
ncbi:MAG: L,D-transpeptidase family protein [Nitrospinota bacterium]|nr:L,D-transpeptidase family protein [Nitrospinota bacterium]